MLATYICISDSYVHGDLIECLDIFAEYMLLHTYVFPLSRYNNTGIYILRNLQSNNFTMAS